MINAACNWKSDVLKRGALCHCTRGRSVAFGGIELTLIVLTILGYATNIEPLNMYVSAFTIGAGAAVFLDLAITCASRAKADSMPPAPRLDKGRAEDGEDVNRFFIRLGYHVDGGSDTANLPIWTNEEFLAFVKKGGALHPNQFFFYYQVKDPKGKHKEVAMCYFDRDGTTHVDNYFDDEVTRQTMQFIDDSGCLYRLPHGQFLSCKNATPIIRMASESVAV